MFRSREECFQPQTHFKMNHYHRRWVNLLKAGVDIDIVGLGKEFDVSSSGHRLGTVETQELDTCSSVEAPPLYLLAFCQFPHCKRLPLQLSYL